MVDLGIQMTHWLVTFYSASAALYAKRLASPHAPCEVIPVPRSVSSSCGYAMDVSGVPLELLTGIMNSASVDWEAVYRPVPEAKPPRYEQAVANDGQGGGG